MKLTTALLALLPILAAAIPFELEPVVRGTTNPDPSKVQIKDITYGGTGCPQGSLSVAISDDRTYVTLIFDRYVASVGDKVPVTENRKNCQLNFDLHYPGGFQFSVFSADYRGYAAIDRGVTGTLKSTYYFSGQTRQTSTESNFVGPVSGDYLKHDEAESASTVWSPCGGEGLLNINSQVRLTSRDQKASGLLTTDSIDAKFTQKLYVKWQTCKT